MNTLKPLFDTLWSQYERDNSQVPVIHQALKERNETIVNDHIAFRSFQSPNAGIDALAKVFLENGYQERGNYHFNAKRLDAKHYEHEDPSFPKVFISELLVDRFSDTLQALVARLVAQIPADKSKSPDFAASQRLWESVTRAEYHQLLGESEYAAWLAAFGFRANHFTILVNELKGFETLESLNRFITELGIELNDAGGLIKGSPKTGLEQSSTRAATVKTEFADGQETIPCCYYEFARRHKLPNGELFNGFVTQSADKLFESTDHRKH